MTTTAAISHICLIFVIMLGSPAKAEIRLPHVFNNHMVLQADKRVPVWGWGEPGERVTVIIANQRVTTRVNEKGRWRAILRPMKPSMTPQTMTVEANNRLRLDDVLVGQVWLGSGQSNMEQPLTATPWSKETIGADVGFASANIPTLRLFKVKKSYANEPLDDVEGQWIVSTPDALRTSEFSAVGFYFGHRLAAELRQPVGVIQSAYGATRIEPWTPPSAAAHDAAFDGYNVATRLPDSSVDSQQYQSVLWNAMVSPLKSYAVSGILWYQGESNIISDDRGRGYDRKLRALIQGWRQAFGADLQFYIAQIAPYDYSKERASVDFTPDTASEVRMAQAYIAAEDTRGGIVTTYDTVTDVSDIHPRDKRTVGERFAALALAQAYGRLDIPTNGPRFAGLKRTNGLIVVRYADGAGLRTVDGRVVTGFEIADAEGRFTTASARVAGRNVEIVADREAVAIRFGWGDTARPNLINGDGLPAVPFGAQRIPH